MCGVPQNDYGHIKPVLSPCVPNITITQYKDWLNRYLPKDTNSRKSALLTCAEMSRNIPLMHSFAKDISIQSIGTAIYGIQSLSEISFPLVQDEPNFPALEKEARACVRVAHGVEKDEFLLAKSKEEKNREVVFYINWILNSSAQYQGDGVYQIPNALILSGLEEFGDLPEEPERINTVFEQSMGISAKDFVMFLFAIWTYSANRNIMINTDSFFNSPQINSSARDKFKGFIQELSFRVGCQLNTPEYNFLIPLSGQRVAEALFLRKPYIQISDKHFLSTGHPFLKTQITHKFLQKAFALAREIEKTTPTSPSFSQNVGDRLERFFMELCNYWEPLGGQLSEYEYLRGSNEKSADRIVFESDGKSETAILFQVKTKTLQEKTFYGVSIESLDKDINVYSEFIYKSINYLYLMDKGLREGNLRNENRAFSERVLNANKWCFIGITPIDPAIFTNVAMRHRLISEVQIELNKINPEINKWFQIKYESGKLLGWHIMGLDHFETFLTLPQEQRFFSNSFSLYLKTSKIDSQLMNFAGEIPSNFRDFIIRYYHQNKDTPLIPRLKAVFDKYGRDVNNYFFTAP